MKEYLWNILLIMACCLLPVLLAFLFDCAKDPGVRRIFEHYKRKAYVNMSSKIASFQSPKRKGKSSKVASKVM